MLSKDQEKSASSISFIIVFPIYVVKADRNLATYVTIWSMNTKACAIAIFFLIAQNLA